MKRKYSLRIAAVSFGYGPVFPPGFLLHLFEGCSFRRLLVTFPFDQGIRCRFEPRFVERPRVIMHSKLPLCLVLPHHKPK